MSFAFPFHRYGGKKSLLNISSGAYFSDAMLPSCMKNDFFPTAPRNLFQVFHHHAIAFRH
jgi:hypothetical protein